MISKDLKTLLLHFDDVIVIANEFHTHLECLTEMFQMLGIANLKLGSTKFKFLQKEVRYLGHVVSA